MRVLLVEDEPRISAYVKRGLEEQGYAVDAAGTGPEALAWAETVPFDLIVLDVMLPEMDGIAVCRELRVQGCQAPILMLTARETIENRVEGLDAGADDYLVKPFALPELVARLRALARRPSGSPRTPILTFEGLTMDTVTRHVERDGDRIRLTAKEYAVLECLLRNPERVLGRREIAEHVWDYDHDNESNVVDVYIRNLRRKMDDSYPRKLIHTVRGAGYLLSLDAVDETV